MQSSRHRPSCEVTTKAPTGDRGWSGRRWLASAAIVGLAVGGAACSSTPNSASSTTHGGSGAFQVISGKGNSTLAPVTLPTKWNIAWHFACESSTTGHRFVVTVTPEGSSPVTATDQNGLEGGGYKPFTKGGSTKIVVTTGCSWTLRLGPPGTDTVTPTTTSTTSTTKAPASGSTTGH